MWNTINRSRLTKCNIKYKAQSTSLRSRTKYASNSNKFLKRHTQTNSTRGSSIGIDLFLLRNPFHLKFVDGDPRIGRESLQHGHEELEATGPMSDQ